MTCTDLFNGPDKAKALVIIQPYTEKIGTYLIANNVICSGVSDAMTNDRSGSLVLCTIILLEFRRHNTDAEYHFRYILTKLGLDLVNQMLNPVSEMLKLN